MGIFWTKQRQNYYVCIIMQQTLLADEYYEGNYLNSYKKNQKCKVLENTQWISMI